MNAFSKTPENQAAAVALHVGWYNLCHLHEALRVTPAMALRVTDYVWTIGELVERALSAPAIAPTPTVPPATLRPGHRPVQLRVIRGGKVSGR